jgi:hypothetical protein
MRFSSSTSPHLRPPEQQADLSVRLPSLLFSFNLSLFLQRLSLPLFFLSFPVAS